MPFFVGCRPLYALRVAPAARRQARKGRPDGRLRNENGLLLRHCAANSGRARPWSERGRSVAAVAAIAMSEPRSESRRRCTRTVRPIPMVDDKKIFFAVASRAAKAAQSGLTEGCRQPGRNGDGRPCFPRRPPTYETCARRRRGPSFVRRFTGLKGRAEPAYYLPPENFGRALACRCGTLVALMPPPRPHFDRIPRKVLQRRTRPATGEENDA